MLKQKIKLENKEIDLKMRTRNKRKFSGNFDITFEYTFTNGTS